MSGPVGIALIGMGWWGQKILAVLQAAPADIRVVRAVEPNLETVKAVCAESGVPLGPAASVLCICEQLSSDLPHGDTVAAYVKFRGGGASYVSASLANPFMSRFTVYGAKGWVDIRDKAHVEAPDGWIVTSAMATKPITTVEIPPAEPVNDNLVSCTRAVRGAESYPITAAQLVDNIALLEAVFASASSGKIQAVA